MKNKNLLRAILISSLGLVIFQLCEFFSLPLINEGLRNELSLQNRFYYNQFGLFALGLGPAVSAFFIVELFSFFMPGFRNLRVSGVSGRRKLNTWALVLTLLIAGWQAHNLVRYLSAALTPHGETILGAGLGLELLSISFFVGGAVLIFVIGEIMTRYGLANGFGLLLGYGICKDVFQNVSQYSGSTPDFVGLLFFGVFLFALFVWCRRSKSITAKQDAKEFSFELPRLPQGAFVFAWASSIILFIDTIKSLIGTPDLQLDFHGWTYASLYLLMIVVLSGLAYIIAYAPSRILNNTFNRISFAENWQHASLRHWTKSTVLLGIGVFLFNMPSPIATNGNFVPYFASLSEIVVFSFIIADVIGHFRFLRRTPSVRCLAELDNIHFATAARGLLRAEGIESHLQGFELRRLFAFINPLFKIRLLVGANDAERARALLLLDKVPIV